MKTILCYGDSNTHGTIPVDLDFLKTPFVASNYRLPWEKRWTGILQKELGSGWLVIEEGLNGRTTVWDDPTEGAHKNGLKYLIPCLESHAPIDLVILMLGTNDLKVKFSASAFDIAMGVGILINTIQNSGAGPGGKAPKVLLLCPPPLGQLTALNDLFGKDGIQKSKDLAKNYQKIAEMYGCKFVNVAEIIKPSKIDGVHYEPEDIKKLGKAIVNYVREMFKY